MQKGSFIDHKTSFLQKNINRDIRLPTTYSTKNLRDILPFSLLMFKM